MRLVELNAGVLPVGVLPGVFVTRVSSHLRGYLLRDQSMDPIRIRPGYVAELVAECFKDVGEMVSILSRLICPARTRMEDIRIEGPLSLANHS